MIALLLVIILFQAVCLIVLVGLAKRQLSLAKRAVSQQQKQLITDNRLLSARETEVLENICLGLSNREIADRLSLSKRTIDRHRANILEKTACNNTAELVVYAVRNGLIKV